MKFSKYSPNSIDVFFAIIIIFLKYTKIWYSLKNLFYAKWSNLVAGNGSVLGVVYSQTRRNPDKISKSDHKTNNALHAIIYEKTFEDGNTYYVEEVRTGREKLALKTMYKKPGNHSGRLMSTEKQPPPITSETHPDPLHGSTTNIQNTEAGSKSESEWEPLGSLTPEERKIAEPAYNFRERSPQFATEHNKYKDKFLKGQGLNRTSYGKLKYAQKKIIDNRWRRSPEFKNLMKRHHPEVWKKYEANLKQKPKGWRPNKGVPNTIKGRVQAREQASEIEVDNPYDEVLQYFASGGKIDARKAAAEMWGGRDSRLRIGAGKAEAAEFEARRGMHEEDAGSIDAVAHVIWENSPMNELYDTQDFRNAVEEVFSNYHNATQAAEALNEKYSQREQQADPYDAQEREAAKSAYDSLSEESRYRVDAVIDAYRDENGRVDWGAMEKDYDGFTPKMLDLSEEESEALYEKIIENTRAAEQWQPVTSYGQTEAGWDNPDTENNESETNGRGAFEEAPFHADDNIPNIEQRIKDAKRQAEKVLNGQAAIRRLQPAGERGRNKGGRRNVEATLLLTADAGGSGPVKGREQQEQAVEAYARAEGIWFGDAVEIEPEIGKVEPGIGEFVNSGTEAQLYLKEGDTNTVRKTIRVSDPMKDITGESNNAVLDFLDNRISLHNDVAKSVPYELSGFARNENGELLAVVEQPYIKNPTKATRAEIDTEYKKRGWAGSRYTYENGTYESTDVKPDNVLKDAWGNLHFIDTQITPKYAVNNERAGDVRFSAGGYRMEHKAPGRVGNSALYDLTGVYGEDIYSNKAAHYFGEGNIKLDTESVRVMQRVRNNPDAIVTVYRAVPKNVNSINDGDWVSISEAYAIEHGESYLGEGYKILKQKVKASQLFTDGNSIHEQGVNFMFSALDGKPNKVVEQSDPKFKRVTDAIRKMFSGYEGNRINILSGEAFLERAVDIAGVDVKVFRNKGTAYGFTQGGKIYLNGDALNLNTPIHEAGHLFTKWAKDFAPHVYNAGIKLFSDPKNPYNRRIRKIKFYQDRIAQYKDTGATAVEVNEMIADEAMAMAVGDKGQRIAENRAAWRQWIKDFWNSIREAIGNIKRWEHLTTFQYMGMKWEGFAEGMAERILSGKKLKEPDIQNSDAGNSSRGAGFMAQDAEAEAATAKERQQIKENAKANGTFMKAPNGKPTNLTEAQWTDVRTTNFKNWFGDWELRHKTVDLVQGLPNEFKDFNEAKAWAKKKIARVYSNNETGGKGEIRISNAAIDKYLSENNLAKSDNKDVHLSVLKVLPDVIRTSVVGESHPDYKKVNGVRKVENGFNKDVHIQRLYGAVGIDDSVYRVKVTLKVDKTSNNPINPYSYEATKIELLTGTLGNSASSLSPNTNNSISTVNLLKGIEKSYEKGKYLLDDYSKVVDENGEPMVVAHSTDKEFYEFKNKQENDSGWLGAGYYFFGERSLDGQYGKNIMDVFLNIREPYYASDEDVSRLSEINDKLESENFTEELRYDGFDGVYYNGNLNQEWVVFRPNQIKSATDNTGAYSSANNDIRLMASEDKFGNGVPDPLYLQKLEEHARAIEEGRSTYNRFTQDENTGLQRGGRIHTEASLIAGRSESASIADQESRVEQQEQDLEDYARVKGIWHENTIADLEKQYEEKIAEGQEAKVFYNPKRKVAVKSSNTLQFRDLQDFLDGITLHNTYFPEAPLTVIGFGRDAEGEFHVIMEQPFIEAGELKPTQQEIIELAKARGFIINTNRGEEGKHFKNEQTLLNDLHDENVIKTPDGRLIVIDSLMHLNTPIWNEGGKREVKNNFKSINFNANDRKKDPIRSLAGERAEGERVYQTLNASYGRGSIGTTKAAGRFGWQKERFLESLQSNAKQYGSWIEDVTTFTARSLGSGHENEVYLAKDGKNVIKVNNLALLDEDGDNLYTRDFGSFINRMLAHNEFAPSVSYEIIGVSKNSKGEISIVTKQPYVKKAKYAPLKDIYIYLRDTGYRPVTLENGVQGFSNGVYEISDVKPENVLQDADNNLHFIDIDINKVGENDSAMFSVHDSAEVFLTKEKAKIVQEAADKAGPQTEAQRKLSRFTPINHPFRFR